MVPPPTSDHEMIAFTTCSQNFLGYALALYASLLAHHSSLTFYVALCDAPRGLDIAQFPFQIISIDELGIPNFDNMRTLYNITELNTAIKPFVFSFLFDKHPDQAITYLDPDIIAVSPFEELQECLSRGANCVLTPHILEPAEFAEMEDQRFLIYGIYNLGFCALRDTSQVRRVVSWWGRRLESRCIIDLQNGLFVDQKWADLLPAYIDDTCILRHPGYNVAYWNLSQRRVRLRGETWTVNGQPLRFFHFSGNKIEDPCVFSRHSSQFNIENIGDVKLLLERYRNTVYRHGHHHFSTIPFAFSWNGAGGQNPHTPRAVSKSREAARVEIPHLPLMRARSQPEFLAARSNLGEVVTARQRIETDAIPFDAQAYTLSGTCACCRGEGIFQVSGMYSSHTLADGRVFPNWREELSCLSCGLVNRVRASLHVLQQEFPPAANAPIYITEQMTPTYKWMQARFPNTLGNDSFPSNRRSGEFINGIQNADLQHLPFRGDEFECILSFDVLEHVPDHRKALKEFFRCLRPTGSLLITVPFRSDSYDHEVRAEQRDDGEIEHFMEPEFHGMPADMEHGSLCFRRFGWRLVDELSEIGFSEAQVLFYWSEQLRYFGDPQLIITARKPATS
jgi:hypothetical protein